ncbi:hypothetical protein HDU76_004459, partial [Blyttiomyces sp. JEL0837]
PEDLHLCGAATAHENVDVNPSLCIHEFRLERAKSKQFLVMLSLSLIKTGFKWLPYILPFDHVDILRLVCGRNSLVYKEPATSTATSQKNLGHLIQPRLNLPSTFNRISGLLESGVWSNLNLSSQVVATESEFKRLVFDNVVHLQFDNANIKSALSPADSTFYQQLESFSVFEMPQNVENDGVANAAGAGSFMNMMDMLVAEKGLPKSVKRLWVERKGGVDFRWGWVQKAEAKGIVVEPFNDPFCGMTYPRSVGWCFLRP